MCASNGARYSQAMRRAPLLASRGLVDSSDVRRAAWPCLRRSSVILVVKHRNKTKEQKTIVCGVHSTVAPYGLRRDWGAPQACNNCIAASRLPCGRRLASGTLAFGTSLDEDPQAPRQPPRDGKRLQCLNVIGNANLPQKKRQSFPTVTVHGNCL